MPEENRGTLSKIGPNLLEPPHILTFLMELLAGDRPPDPVPQEQVSSHLLSCHYCRTALMFLLEVAQGYDRRNNNIEKPVRDLLAHFENISQEAEAREAREAQDFELMGAYAEAIAAEGQEKADQSFPDIAAHVQICPDCLSVVKATVADLTEPEETD